MVAAPCGPIPGISWRRWPSVSWASRSRRAASNSAIWTGSCRICCAKVRTTRPRAATARVLAAAARAASCRTAVSCAPSASRTRGVQSGRHRSGGGACERLGRARDAEHVEDTRTPQVDWAGQLGQEPRERGEDDHELVVQALSCGCPRLDQVASRARERTQRLDIVRGDRAGAGETREQTARQGEGVGGVRFGAQAQTRRPRGGLARIRWPPAQSGPPAPRLRRARSRATRAAAHSRPPSPRSDSGGGAAPRWGHRVRTPCAHPMRLLRHLNAHNAPHRRWRHPRTSCACSALLHAAACPAVR
jgi:hypothetical protein